MKNNIHTFCYRTIHTIAKYFSQLVAKIESFTNSFFPYKRVTPINPRQKPHFSRTELLLDSLILVH